MTEQIEIHGQRVELYSLDEGRTWSMEIMQRLWGYFSPR